MRSVSVLLNILGISLWLGMVRPYHCSVLAVGMPHFRGLASVIALPQDCTATPEIWIDLRLTDMSDTIDDSTHFHTLMPSCRVSPDVTGVASEQTIAHSTTQ